MVEDIMDIEDVKAELKMHGVNLHHKTGETKLRETLEAVNTGTYTSDEEEVEVEIKPIEPPRVEKLTPEQEALKLVRIVVTPNDSLMASYPGLIFSVGNSTINRGRMVKKYVPFNNEEGWHVPHIIYEQICNAEMQKFKQIKLPNGEKTLAPYIAKKFNVTVLPSLTQAEISTLADQQKSRGDA